ncbi:cytochrome c [Roseibacterium sp. SDUM158017]|uniref:c-type cytochrome n=1 Tax=Roseicyclus salinarum TaxID=3036773 RepID=UPI002414E7E2|nr:cytochrome c [Roseibacterium sp. SDUM158017]MDG4649028.1 cytochrome c [Roseibacterium sp. SDUM158017]
MTRSKKIIAGAAVLAAGGLGVWVWQAEAQDRLPGQILRWQDEQTVTLGAGIYAAECADCHGADLEGQADWQVRMGNGRLPAPPHDETGHTWHHPDALLIAITAQGTAAMVGGDYESDMMGFGDRLSEDEIVAVLSYIKSTWPEEVIDIHNQVNARAAMEGGG